MTRVLLATRNAGKVRELARLLEAVAPDVELVGLDAFPEVPDVAETGLSFAENATLKALAYASATGVVAVADDSGLCVDVLGGMPGIFSARWAGRHGDDVANLDLLLAQLSDVADEHRRGAFHCAAVAALPDGRCEAVEARMPGRVIRQPRGTEGFGYDPIFVPEGESRTSAELTAEEKDALSHRGQALRKLLPRLRALLDAAAESR